MTRTTDTPAPLSSDGRDQRSRQQRRLRRTVAAITVGIAAVVVIGSVGTPGGSAEAANPAWRLVWADEFDGARGTKPDPATWTIQTGAGGWGNKELQTYTTAAVQLDGAGALTLTATIGGTPAQRTYTSARITSQGKGSFTYGRLEARIKLPQGQGLLPAFWLMGENLPTVGWPAAGEIDVVETPNTTSITQHHVHAPSTTSATAVVTVGGGENQPAPMSAGYHVYSVEKTQGRIVLGIDGRAVLTVTPSSLRGGRWVFDQPTHALFSLAIGGVWPGPPNSTTPPVSVMSIDWLHLYGP